MVEQADVIYIVKGICNQSQGFGSEANCEDDQKAEKTVSVILLLTDKFSGEKGKRQGNSNS